MALLANDLLDKTNVGVFLYWPVIDRIESFGIKLKLFPPVLIVIETDYVTGEVLHVLRLKKLYSIFAEIVRDHLSSGNDSGNPKCHILQKLRRKNSIREDVAPVGNNTDMDRSNKF